MDRPLSDRVEAFNSTEWRRTLIAFPFLAGGVFFLSHPLLGMPFREFEFAHWLRLVLLILWFPGFLGLLRILEQRKIQRLNLRCPDCETALVRNRGKDAAKYGVCPQCGNSLKTLN